MLLSEELTRIYGGGGEETTFGQFLDRIDDKGFGALLAVCALPSFVPGPPGYATIFGIPCAILSWQVLLRRDMPWFPKRILERKMAKSGKKQGRFIRWSTALVKFVERFLKPRLTLFHRTKTGHTILGLVMFLCSCSMILPVPLTNSIPAVGIVLIALSMFEDDGIVAILGMIVGLLGLFVTLAVFYFLITYGLEGLKMAEEWYGGLF